MRLALAMIVKNEAFYLSVILPRIRDAFDEIIVTDAESTDYTRDILKAMGAKVTRMKWHGYSQARNATLERVTADWVAMLDADEAMFPRDLEQIRGIIERESSITTIVLPRYEFCGGHSTHSAHWYPDYQKRIFRANLGYRFCGTLHEGLSPLKGVPEVDRKIPEIHIYHYGQAKPPEIVWLRHENYRRLEAKEPLLEAVPEGFHVPGRTGVPFLGDHPLKGVPAARDFAEYCLGRWTT